MNDRSDGAISARHGWLLWLPMVLLLVPSEGFGQAHRNPARLDSIRHIQSMEPHVGPPGTEVRLFTENLPLQASVKVGVGGIGTGFEELGPARQGEFGEVGASVNVPEDAPWDRAVVFIIFNGNFAPIGHSDPFHVTDGEGRVQRTGVLEPGEAGCTTFRDDDGYFYSLVGDVGDSLAGEPSVVEGRIVRSVACAYPNTIEVATIEAVRDP